VLDECSERNAGIVLASFLEFRPGRLGVKVGLEGHQADAQGRKVAVEVMVLGAGSVLAHAGVAHPVVTAFATAPVAAGQVSKEAGAIGSRGVAGGVEGDDGFLAFVEGAGALDDDQAARSGQTGLEGFEGIDLDAALV
jgi:hypothetical protein